MTKRKVMYCEHCKERYQGKGGGKGCSLRCRILMKIEKNGSCWEWNGILDVTGYGRISHKNKLMNAHRASYEVFVGEIPKGLWVLHKCDNRCCVNPEHLFIGTPKDNTHDMMRKKKVFDFVGEKNNCAVLTEEQVLEYKKAF